MSLWTIRKGRKKEKEHTRKKEKEHTRKKRDGIRTTELNRRDQVTAAKSWPSFHRKTGAEVDNQVAAPTELGTPTMHRAKIAQPRVRMEGWRQRRPGSNARNPREGKRKQKEKNTLDSYRPTHGRIYPGQDQNWESREDQAIAIMVHVVLQHGKSRRSGSNPNLDFLMPNFVFVHSL